MDAAKTQAFNNLTISSIHIKFILCVIFVILVFSYLFTSLDVEEAEEEVLLHPLITIHLPLLTTSMEP